MEKLGFIGLGSMGMPMAGHLLRAGYPMSVYARRADAAAPLAALGARLCSSPQELGAASDVVFTMVTHSKDVEDVVLGDGGVLHGLRAGGVLVDMETISPITVKRVGDALAARGVDMLDAPVSGGPAGARQGSLSIMVGGKPGVFERIKPLFQCLGKAIIHVGDAGAGQVAKACNQLALTVTMQGVAEALTLARRYGVDVAKVREVLAGGVAASRVLDVFGSRMVARDFADGIDARFYHKDLNIVLDLAHELGLSVPACALVMQSFNALMGRGEGRLDASAIIRLLEGGSERPGPGQ